MKNYLIFDIGTGNTRVSLVSSSNDLIAVKTFENQYKVDNNYEDAQYFDPKEWKSSILSVTKELLAEYSDIKISAISSTGARQSVVLIDNNGEEFYGLPNIDNRGKAWVREIPCQDLIAAISGRWVSEDFVAAKLLGFKKIYKDRYKCIDTFTSLSEWIAYIFTKEICIEPSHACETQLYDINNWEWSKDLMHYFGLYGFRLPKIMRGGSILKYISDDMKKYLGISYDIPFVIGGADTQVAILGAGIQVNDIGIISGTTSPVVCMLDNKPSRENEKWWTDCFVKDFTYMIETNPGVTGLNYQRSKKLLFDEISYEELEDRLREVKSIKCVALFSSLDFENARSFRNGGFLLRPPLSSDFSRIDMLYAIVADIACAIYYQYLNLVHSISLNKNYILGCGGGFQSSILCQHIANLTQRELRLIDGFAQSSTLGCVRLCSQAVGEMEVTNEGKEIIYKPNEEKLIHEYYNLWCDYRKNLIKEGRDVC